mmetsp:Transcript_124696/g.248949  ORF Transcript_124696/g.248949 Transcript_124696/m.248949 type:complete len:90 (+) Transcript_124696:813-1082(+)
MLPESAAAKESANGRTRQHCCAGACTTYGCVQAAILHSAGCDSPLLGKPLQLNVATLSNSRAGKRSGSIVSEQWQATCSQQGCPDPACH